MSYQENQPSDRVPLPPPEADVLTTACDYCIVACGYKVYRWPVGKEGGSKAAAQRATASTIPSAPLTEQGGLDQPQPCTTWSPPAGSRSTTSWWCPTRDTDGGQPERRPQRSAAAVMAKKCYNPETPTRDRLQSIPMMRVGGKLDPGELGDRPSTSSPRSRSTSSKKHGVHAWAQKHVLLPVLRKHLRPDQARPRPRIKHPVPSPGTTTRRWPPATPGFRDVGFDNFARQLQGLVGGRRRCYIAGTDPFETKTIVCSTSGS